MRHRYARRLWLWWHGEAARPRRPHRHMRLADRVWSCSCGSTFDPVETPKPDITR